MAAKVVSCVVYYGSRSRMIDREKVWMSKILVDGLGMIDMEGADLVRLKFKLRAYIR
jgi:hypothetical protein